MDIEGIVQSCVIAKERTTDNSTIKYLVGYYVLDGELEALDSAVILEHLSSVLPDYMVPSSLVVMDSFPLTVNGKLDKKALPDPTFVSADNYVAPTTDLERELCSIWEALLGIDRVGVTDNFFRIGGDSILSTQLSSRIRQSGYDCQVKDIFESKTIANLSVLISSKSSVLVIDSEQGIFVERSSHEGITHLEKSQLLEALKKRP